jgi:hypothetical protein
MDVSQLIADFGNYYLQEGQNASRLFSVLNFTQARDPRQREQLTADLLTPVMTDETIWRASETRMTRLLQAFQKAWTPVGEASFIPIEIRMFKMKADFQDYPDDIEESWLGFLASNQLDRKTWPIVRYLVEQLMIPQLVEDYELNEIYKGVAAAPTPGTPGAAGASMNGLGKVIADQITAGRIAAITTGPIETDPVLFVDQVNDFAKSIDLRYRSVPMTLNMDKELAWRYEEGFDLKYNQNYRQMEGNYRVRYTNMEVRGVHSMAGSSRIWATPKANVVKLMKKTQNMKQFKIENTDRLVKLYTDFFSGVGFVIPELVFCNDQV